MKLLNKITIKNNPNLSFLSIITHSAQEALCTTDLLHDKKLYRGNWDFTGFGSSGSVG